MMILSVDQCCVGVNLLVNRHASDLVVELEVYHAVSACFCDQTELTLWRSVELFDGSGNTGKEIDTV
jgi:hypothetical protein